MTIYLYDDKHDNIIDCLEVGDLDLEQKELLEDLFFMLRKNGVLTRYKELTIADSFSKDFDEESGEYTLAFKGQE